MKRAGFSLVLLILLFAAFVEWRCSPRISKSSDPATGKPMIFVHTIPNGGYTSYCMTLTGNPLEIVGVAYVLWLGIKRE